MGIKQIDSLKHWNYFISLEEDVSRIARYIELHENNFNTFSLELTRVLFSAVSEVDVVAKLLCSNLGNGKANNITTYRKTIIKKFPNFHNIEVLAPRYGISLHPWSNWSSSDTPIWWKANNYVKHQRDVNFEKSNLKNVLNSVSGLFVILLYYYRQDAVQGNIRPNPSLFRIGNPFTLDQYLSDYDITLAYEFND